MSSSVRLDTFELFFLTPEEAETLKSVNIVWRVHQSSPPRDSGPLHLLCHSNNLMNILLSYSDAGRGTFFGGWGVGVCSSNLKHALNHISTQVAKRSSRSCTWTLLGSFNSVFCINI